jgi:hypothetical protein
VSPGKYFHGFHTGDNNCRSTILFPSQNLTGLFVKQYGNVFIDDCFSTIDVKYGKLTANKYYMIQRSRLQRFTLLIPQAVFRDEWIEADISTPLEYYRVSHPYSANIPRFI